MLWSLGDHIGSIRDVVRYNPATNTTQVANHLFYDAFGNIVSESDVNLEHRFAFTGREWDEEIDLQYNRARYYDPQMGRWISKDPLGFDAGDMNLYRYVGNGPTDASDPSGLDEFPPATVGGVGQHWVPQAVYGTFYKNKQIDDAAKNYFYHFTTPTQYYRHGGDTWLGVTHGRYNEAATELLTAYKAKISPNAPLTVKHAEEFANYMKTGVFPEWLYDTAKKAANDVAKWGKGFRKSLTIATAAMVQNPNLTPEEVKAIARRLVNDEAIELSAKAAKVVNELSGSAGKPLIRAAGKKVFGLFAVAFTALAASKGFAGEGHRPVDGVTGAVVEAAYEAMFAEQVEDYVFPAVRSFFDYWFDDVFGFDKMGERYLMRQRQKVGDF